MRIPSSTVNRMTTAVGCVCLAIALLLLPAGVRIVRADQGEAVMSVDPELVAEAARVAKERREERPAHAAPVVAPILPADVGEAVAERPGIAGREIRPGVIVLNTRGYNYGPPPAQLDPAALGHESDPR